MGSSPRAQTLIGNERGQGLAEYIIIAILIAIIVIVGIRYFGSSVSSQFQNATEEVSHLGPGDKAAPVAGAGSSSVGHESSGHADDAKAGESGGGGGSGSDSGSKNHLKAKAVGEREKPISEQIELDWKTLGLIALAACGVGVFVVFQTTQDKKKGKVKKQKKKLFPKRGNKNGSSGGQSGQAMVEFLFVSITFLFTILGVIQLAMCLNAYALVRYAAFNAARAAIVHGGNQDKMDEAARISLLAVFPTHGRADQPLGFMQNYVAAKLTDHTGLVFNSYFHDDITQVKIINGVAPGEVATFDDPAQADKGIITVQVLHNYELVIPLVNRILFYVYTKFRSGEGYQGETLDRLSALTNQKRRTGDFQDIEYRIPLVAHYTMRLQSDYAPN